MPHRSAKTNTVLLLSSTRISWMRQQPSPLHRYHLGPTLQIQSLSFWRRHSWERVPQLLLLKVVVLLETLFVLPVNNSTWEDNWAEEVSQVLMLPHQVRPSNPIIMLQDTISLTQSTSRAVCFIHSRVFSNKNRQLCSKRSSLSVRWVIKFVKFLLLTARIWILAYKDLDQWAPNKV